MNKLMVLHLANGFSTNALYANLLDNLHELFEGHAVLSFSSEPTVTQRRTRSNYGYSTEFLYIKKPWDRFFYFNKIKKFSRNAFNYLKINSPKLIHAHTLYSDGGVAYEIKRKFNIPYIVAIRNTDLNVFAKFRPDLSSYRDQILLESDAIILISPAYKDKLHSLLKSVVWNKIKDRIHIIPNGIDDFWFVESTPKPMNISCGPRLLYVGDFSKNKNLHGLLRAFSSLDPTLKSTLTIVGGGGGWDKKIKNLITKYNVDGRINFLGVLQDKSKLRDFYRDSDLLVIPSFHETFGLSYVEALSQGVPCVHTRGEGIDGYFLDGEVSLGCDPYCINDIKNTILQMVGCKREKFSTCISAASGFRWSNIAEKYIEIYKNSIFR